MLYGWEIVAWLINEMSTWSSILLNLLFTLVIVLTIAWVGDRNSFARSVIALTLAGVCIFTFHTIGQANFVLGSNAEILAKMHKKTYYYNVAEIVSIEHNVYDPAVLTVRRQNSIIEEVVLANVSGFGLGNIEFSRPKSKENVPDLETLYADETQEESDARRLRENNMRPVSKTPIVKAIEYTDYYAVGLELLYLDGSEPVVKSVEMRTHGGTLSIPMSVSAKVSFE